MARYLIDSDILIWVLRDRQDTVGLLGRLAIESGQLLSCSAVSVIEIWTGTKPSEVQQTAELLDTMDVIPVDTAIARRAAELLRTHRRGVDPREWIDALIASTALTLNLSLVTYNRRDYPYPGLYLYPL